MIFRLPLMPLLSPLIIRHYFHYFRFHIADCLFSDATRLRYAAAFRLSHAEPLIFAIDYCYEIASHCWPRHYAAMPMPLLP
jgi:hypothetical protein